jgi:hypothetical protein
MSYTFRDHIDTGRVTPAMWDAARDDFLAALDADTLTTELYEAGEPLLAAIKKRDPALIGRMVLAVADEWAKSTADWHFFDEHRRGVLSAEEVARKVLEAA